MKKEFVLMCVLALGLLSGCSYREFGAVATGASLGGVFGSSIGGLMGGFRGADAGRAIGMLAGGATGAAVANAGERSSAGGGRAASPDAGYGYDDIDYGLTERPASRYGARAARSWDFIEVSHLRFTDSNNNRCLDAGEEAWLEMEIHNRGHETMTDVAPVIACDNKRILISPTAIVRSLRPGGGVRYRAAVVGRGNLRDGEATFTVSFGSGRDKVTARTFRLRTAR